MQVDIWDDFIKCIISEKFFKAPHADLDVHLVYV